MIHEVRNLIIVGWREWAALPELDRMLLVVTWTVAASVVLHGMTSVPLAERYGRWWSARAAEEMPEGVDVEMMATR